MRTKEYWENKHPKIEMNYGGRPLPSGGEYEIDVRHFVWADDNELKHLAVTIGKGGCDDRALQAQRFVVNGIEYASDETLGAAEFWLFPAETLERGAGDCEDGANLMASLLLHMLPESERWRVRVSAGWVKATKTAPQGGHAYCTYCRESDGAWVILDWCYYEDSEIPVADKPLMRDCKRYKDIWWSFSHEFAWSYSTLSMSGRVKDVPKD